MHWSQLLENIISGWLSMSNGWFNVILHRNHFFNLVKNIVYPCSRFMLPLVETFVSCRLSSQLDTRWCVSELWELTELEYCEHIPERNDWCFSSEKISFFDWPKTSGNTIFVRDDRYMSKKITFFWVVQNHPLHAKKIKRRVEKNDKWVLSDYSNLNMMIWPYT